MIFSKSTVAALTAAVACVHAAVPITGDKMGAATFTDAGTASSNTIVVYQAQDRSVHYLAGSGPPSAASPYSDGLVLAAGKARNDTPLAIIADGTDASSTVHMYYYLSTECPGGNILAEAYRDPTTGGWSDGLLANQQLCASGLSNFLYAIAAVKFTDRSATVSTNRIRVGYMAASTGYLSEAYAYFQNGVNFQSAAF